MPCRRACPVRRSCRTATPRIRCRGRAGSYVPFPRRRPCRRHRPEPDCTRGSPGSHGSGMPVLWCGDLPVCRLGTGEHDPTDADLAGHLADVDRTHGIDLKAQQWIGLHLPGHQRSHEHNALHGVLLGRGHQRRQVGDVGLHDRKLSGDVAGKGWVGPVLQHHGKMPSFEQLAGDRRAVDSQAAGDQHVDHVCLPLCAVD